MGIIKRQSIKQSIVNYLAVGIAAISIIFIYPLEKEIYGLATFVLSTAQLCTVVVILGYTGVAVRFYPQFREESKSGQGYLFYLSSWLALGAVVLILIWLVFKEEIIGLYEGRPEVYFRFFPHIVALSIILAFFRVYTFFTSNFKRIVVPAILSNLIKFVLPVLVLLYLSNKINVAGVVNGLIINYLLAFVLLVGYIYWLGELKLKPDFSWFTKRRRKEISVYATFGMASVLGTVLAFRIDAIMISYLIDFKSNGAYAIAAFIGNVIAIPTTAIVQITSPIVVEAIKKNDLAHVSFMYKQSSVNLLLSGLFLFVCILVSVEDLFRLMPKNEEMTGGFIVVALIAGSKIMDMASSINSPIIGYSKYFRYVLVAIFIMAAINIAANYLLIPKFGIIGAAMATFGSITIFNLIKCLFIYWKFDMQPFSKKTIYLLLIAAVSFLVAYFMPVTGKAVIDIILRSVTIAIIYIPAIYYFNISEDVNEIIINVFKKLKR